jgi:hypothetical protein
MQLHSGVSNVAPQAAPLLPFPASLEEVQAWPACPQDGSGKGQAKKKGKGRVTAVGTAAAAAACEEAQAATAAGAAVAVGSGATCASNASPTTITDSLCELHFRISATSFFQVGSVPVHYRVTYRTLSVSATSAAASISMIAFLLIYFSKPFTAWCMWCMW